VPSSKMEMSARSPPTRLLTFARATSRRSSSARVESSWRLSSQRTCSSEAFRFSSSVCLLKAAWEEATPSAILLKASARALTSCPPFTSPSWAMSPSPSFRAVSARPMIGRLNRPASLDAMIRQSRTTDAREPS
jgi:hypothetical protein